MEISGKCFENSRFDGEEGELPFPPDVNEAAGLQFLDVMGEGGGRDGESFAGHCAGERTACAGNLLEKFEALRVREGLENGSALGAGKAAGLGERGGIHL